MVKRKLKSSPISIELARWGIIAVLIFAVVIVSWFAVASFVRHSRLFTVHAVSVAESLGALDVPELAALKGRNIFTVDLARIQARILAGYPQIADLEVMRRFPDEIVITGMRRAAFAAALIDGRTVVLSRDGYFLGSPGKEEASLVLLKGLGHQKTMPGTLASGEITGLALQVIDRIGQDSVLPAFHLRSMDLTDPGRIILVFGRIEDAARFEVIMDKDNCLARLKTVAAMLGRTEFAVTEVKYIDLRFESPVIGKRKVKK
jgi:hypothetical protein